MLFVFIYVDNNDGIFVGHISEHDQLTWMTKLNIAESVVNLSLYGVIVWETTQEGACRD